MAVFRKGDIQVLKELGNVSGGLTEQEKQAAL